MEKALAAKIMEAALSLGKEIGNLDSLISQLDNGAEKEEFVQALGKYHECPHAGCHVSNYPRLSGTRP
jgi:hypothetical protein